MPVRCLPLLLFLFLAAHLPFIAEGATVAAGASHTVVVTPDNTVWVWGANGSGQLGDATTTGKSVPTQLPTLSGIVAVAAGSSHTLALKNDGTVYAWGANSYGQLGDNTTTQRTSPIVVNVTGIVAIAAGEHHSVALASDGRVWVWGRNSYGQVGKGSDQHERADAAHGDLAHIRHGHRRGWPAHASREVGRHRLGVWAEHQRTTR